MRKFLLVLFVLIVVVGCEKDEDSKPATPFVEMVAVNITSSGITFNGKVTNVNGAKISDYGFYWQNSYYIQESYNKSLGTLSENKTFQIQIDPTFAPGSQYFAQAYYVIDGVKHYSNEYYFALPTPTITNLAPSFGRPGDSFSIGGSGFIPGRTKAFLAETELEILAATSESIQVRVPQSFPAGYYSVMTITNGVTSSYYYDGFRVQTLYIDRIEPEIGTFKEEVTIFGSGFTTSSNVSVRFGWWNAEIKEITSEYIKVLVPAQLQQTPSTVSVNVNWESADAPKQFSLYPPSIKTISPTSGTFSTTITITGENFSPTWGNTVRLGDQELQIVEVSNTTIKANVHLNFLAPEGGTAKITVTTLGQVSAESSDDFRWEDHTVTDVSPLVGKRGSSVVITGTNFNPGNSNRVFFGETEGIVTNTSATSLAVRYPPELSGGNYDVKVVVAGREVIAAQQVTFKDPWKKVANVGGGARTNAVSFVVGGKAFVAGGFSATGSYKNDLYQYVPSSNTWTRRNDIPINGRGMTAFSTTTKAYILFQKELWQYNPETNKWLSKADFPGDAISWQSSFSIGDKGYVGTGTTPEGNYTGEFYEYDEASDEWHVLNSMPRGGTQGIGFAVDEKGYLGLGTHGSLYEYSTGVNEWQFKTNYPTNSYWVSRSDLVASTGNGKVYMGSGNYYGSLTEFYEFDPAQNKITRLSDAPGPGRMNAFSFFLEGKLYVGGGQAYMGGPVYGDFYEYDPLKEEF